MKKINLKFGFTLIELMVVISIIAILSVIVFASFDDARSQARDKVRMNDLKQVQVALNLYRAQNGQYPSQGCGSGNDFAGAGTVASGFEKCDSYINGLVPDYIEVLPIDPNGTSEAGKGFYYRSNGDSYKFMVVGVEAIKVSGAGDALARCPVEEGACASGIPSDIYAVYSKGAEKW